MKVEARLTEILAVYVGRGDLMNRHLVDVRRETILPITIEAESEQEAEEKVREGFGEPGQYSPGETVIVSVRLLDD